MPINKLLTLAFLRQPGKVLLGFKKRGFGAGLWNGFGGKVQHLESIESAALREIKEECGLTATNLREIGLLLFEFVGDPQLLEVHVYETNSFSGNLIESDEMRPQWYQESDVPYSTMWPDDHLWFPYMLTGQQFYGYFIFSDMKTIQSYNLEKVEDILTFKISQRALQTTCDSLKK